jgi:hypothetical protein
MNINNMIVLYSPNDNESRFLILNPIYDDEHDFPRHNFVIILLVKTQSGISRQSMDTSPFII